jgi:hypothetical protein
MKPRTVMLAMSTLVLATGCGTSQVHQAAATGKLAPRSGGQAQPVSSSNSSTTATARCVTAHLSMRLGTAGHAAGSTYVPIVFTNTGTSSCTLAGYPGVSFVAPGSGDQVGAAAARNSHLSPHTITLAAGGHASAMLQVVNYQNFPAKDCSAATVSGLRVYPPGSTAAGYVRFSAKGSACSTSVEQLTIQAVVRGSSGH